MVNYTPEAQYYVFLTVLSPGPVILLVNVTFTLWKLIETEISYIANIIGIIHDIRKEDFFYSYLDPFVNLHYF